MNEERKKPAEEPEQPYSHLRRAVLSARLERLKDLRSEASDKAVKKRGYRAWLNALPQLIAAGGFVLGVIKYGCDRNDELAKREQKEQRLLADQQATRDLDARHELWVKQLDLYFRASEDSAVIATTHDPAKRTAATEDFWALYWGPLVIVEDKALLKSKGIPVETEMVAFGNS